MLNTNKGKGWVKSQACGCKKKSRGWKYANLRLAYEKLLADGILAYPVENFGRFNRQAKLINLAVALALYDANISYAKAKKKAIAILGSTPNGCLEANLAYFRDYWEAGRTLGRGNLFIYTLPSSPLAEAAIHFGFTGKLLYLGFPRNAEKETFKYALNMLKSGTDKIIILVQANAHSATAQVLQKTK